MANLNGLTAAELRTYLLGQTRKLKLLKTILIVAIVVVVLSVTAHAIYYYNYLTYLYSDVKAVKSKVEAAMQYRANLTPLLIESVVSFVEHEDNVFKAVVDGRERSVKTPHNSLKELKESVKTLNTSDSLKGMDTIMDKIIAFAEQYPDLKTAVPFQLLMTKASDTEAAIYNQRIALADKVNIYTTAIAMFPGNFYVSFMFNFPDYDYFKSEFHSEWPHFDGKKHNGWPEVSVKSSLSIPAPDKKEGDGKTGDDKEVKPE